MPVQVVQFVHPGFEYHVGGRYLRSGVMSWKPGKCMHRRGKGVPAPMLERLADRLRPLPGVAPLYEDLGQRGYNKRPSIPANPLFSATDAVERITAAVDELTNVNDLTGSKQWHHRDDKVAAPTAPAGHFTKQQFRIDLDRAKVTCPARLTVAIIGARAHGRACARPDRSRPRACRTHAHRRGRTREACTRLGCPPVQDEPDGDGPGRPHDASASR
jgi:hypothetical protein